MKKIKSVLVLLTLIFGLEVNIQAQEKFALIPLDEINIPILIKDSIE